jgi:hypothetical protein
MQMNRGVSGRVICFSRVALEMSSKMKFLFTKSFHPGNAENVKQVYLAEEKAKSRAKLDELNVRERQKEIEKEQMLKLLGKAGDKDAARAAAMAPVSFLYAPPPGLNEPGKAPPPPGMTREEAHLVAAISGDIPPEDIEGIPAAPKRLSMIEKFPQLAHAPVVAGGVRELETFKARRPLAAVYLRNIYVGTAFRPAAAERSMSSLQAVGPQFGRQRVPAQRRSRSDGRGCKERRGSHHGHARQQGWHDFSGRFSAVG